MHDSLPIRYALGLFLLASFPLTMACADPPLLQSSGPTAVTGTSNTLKVAGEYRPVDIAQVDKLSVDNGKLVLHGPNGQVAVDLPDSADGPKRGQEWMLITESEGTGQHDLTFTHEQSLDDFTLRLPVTGADLKYGTLAGKDGRDLVVFAWGREQRSFWGFVTIARPATPAQH